MDSSPEDDVWSNRVLGLQGKEAVGGAGAWIS